METSVLVIFKKNLEDTEKRKILSMQRVALVVAPIELSKYIHEIGYEWVSIEQFISAGSIYEASALAEELSLLTFPDGTRISKSFIYKGYELWWMHYNKLYLYTCLPYTQYKKLLVYLKDFDTIYFYGLQYRNLFTYYFEAYGCTMHILREPGLKSPAFLPFGVFVQIVLTVLYVPILMVQKKRLLIFTSDLFDIPHDYDFRLKFIYNELRERKIQFVEFVRSMESWNMVLRHAFTRRRPVVYTEAIAFVSHIISAFTGGHRRAVRQFKNHAQGLFVDKELKFKLLVASQSLLTVYDDVLTIRIMKQILGLIGIKKAFISTAADRNYHTVIACKLSKIPMVGILHGASSRSYNLYDFLPTYDGKKSITVDTYGVWSEWWKEYYLKNSAIYTADQLFVSGPMRPIQKKYINNDVSKSKREQILRVLFVSETIAVPTEVLPYLLALMEARDLSVYIKFRSSQDAFETWLETNHPDIIQKIGKGKIYRGTMDEAIGKVDIVVGSHSTGVIEALLQSKPFVLFNTQKWGDYFDLRSFDAKYHFFAENPRECVEYVRMGKEIPKKILDGLCEKFFGDPYKNGSKWVVDQLVDR